MLTERGYFPVSLIAQGWTLDKIIRETAWGKIAPAIKDDAAAYRSNWGWQASELLPNGKIYYPIVEHDVRCSCAEHRDRRVGQGHRYRRRSYASYSGKPISAVLAGSCTSIPAGTIRERTSYEAKGAFSYLGAPQLAQACHVDAPLDEGRRIASVRAGGSRTWISRTWACSA